MADAWSGHKRKNLFEEEDGTSHHLMAIEVRGFMMSDAVSP